MNKDAKSPFWMVTFTDSKGKQKRRSTKIPHAGGMVDGVQLSARAARKVAEQRGWQIAMQEQDSPKKQARETVRAVFTRALERKAKTAKPNTYKGARQMTRLFMDFLGKKADAPLQELSREDMKEYASFLAASYQPSTAKLYLTMVKSVLNEAEDMELISKSPAQRIHLPRTAEPRKTEKEAFTMEEIRHILTILPPEWQSAVQCCIGTFGQRLGDILRLRWERINWTERTITIDTQKTGKHLVQPMTQGFYDWLHAKWEREGCPESGLLHPSLHAKGGSASEDFSRKMKAAGIGSVRISKKGHRLRTKTFHSLRSTVVTMLHSAGVAQGIAMHLVGHDTASIHQVYVRPNQQQLAEAAAKLGTS